MSPVLLVLTVLAARSDLVLSAIFENGVKNSFKTVGGAAAGAGSVLPSGCLYEGAWFRNGASVPTGEACLRCACGAGALSCRRRACAPLPDPPPPRCHVLHRRGTCCPELHCPDGVISMEHSASARFENDDVDSNSFNHGVFPACVEGGTVYAAGSAMRSSVACEQCFCLGGARRCVRPTCLPPPPGCKPRPAPGACCPQRYYCEHRTTKPPEDRHPHDCKIDGKWIVEGEKVTSAELTMNCTQCFCLRGAVQCQPLSCAPPLLGCKPLLRPGECCAHQYACERNAQVPTESRLVSLSNIGHISARNNNQIPKSSSTDTTKKTTLASIYDEKNTQTTAGKNHLVSRTKVKRKTEDPPPEEFAKMNKTTIIDSASKSTKQPTTKQSTTTKAPTTNTQPTTTKQASITKQATSKKQLPTTIKVTTTTETSTTEGTTEVTSTEQPEGSVRIMINGTINCTAELSSTSLPLNISQNDTERIKMESLPRIPLIDVDHLEDHTFAANEIITDRTVNGNFDDNESFVINVTSSLMTNTSKPSTKPPPPVMTKISVPTASQDNIAGAVNSSKKTKGDYDYDYTQPTLPPSLPNLKIIPFVAADAVVDDEQKESLTYPMLEREDKFPVYYPTADSKNTAYSANRREDTYHPTQYPVFITDKVEHEYPSIAQDIDLTSTGYSNVQPELGTAMNEYTVSASLGNQITDTNKVMTQSPPVSTTFKLETPSVNLFSPPMETEGGFVPKGPNLIDEFYASFSSTPAGPVIPHLTTSMQLDVGKGECVLSDGRPIPEGATVAVSCSECTCAWGALRCAPRVCPAPPGCTRRPASAGTADLCCGDLLCDDDNKTTPEPVTIPKKEITTSSIDIKSPHNHTINKTPDSTDKMTVQIDVPVMKQNKTQLTMESSSKTTTDSKKKDDRITSPTTNTERPTTEEPTAATAAAPVREHGHNHSLEYEDDEEDEGFSFGSVLKLLLSDNYDTTTTAPKRIATTKILPPVRTTTTTRRPRPPPPPAAPKPSIAPFVPLPPYIPPKISHNPINRIDHLVLGESTAIKKTTPKPVTTTFRPVKTSRPTTRVTKPAKVSIDEKYTTQEGPRPPGPPNLPGVGGLLKLAGCNIYGRMYRVGRIITELSTPCQECWCTEFGVQCKQLKC